MTRERQLKSDIMMCRCYHQRSRMGLEFQAETYMANVGSTLGMCNRRKQLSNLISEVGDGTAEFAARGMRCTNN